jgi:hypothetical protein
MAKLLQAQNPLLLRYHRLMDAFAKSDDERDFYLDKLEGFILFVDLDKGQLELDELFVEMNANPTRYCLIPKMTYYETKKFMEGFVNEKVYDIDTKEKLLDIIQSKEARENFLEFIYDHLTELEKWQQYYHERSRIRIIEWLRSQSIQFVFEEDLDLNKNMLEKLKRHLFDAKVAKDIAAVRETLVSKAKTYYSNEALNPRPKRGRPPKQVAKVEIEPQVIVDMYTTVPPPCRPFLFLPEITNVTFSAKFKTEAELLASLRGSARGVKLDTKLHALSQKLDTLLKLSSKLVNIEEVPEQRLIKAINQTAEEERLISEKMESEEGVEKKRGLFDVVKGLLPGKKKERPGKAKESKGVKMVTPIEKKLKKKG